MTTPLTIKPGNPKDAARGLQLILAIIDDDAVALGALDRDLTEDPRGLREAAWALISVLSLDLTKLWTRGVEKDAVAAMLRERIQHLATQPD